MAAILDPPFWIVLNCRMTKDQDAQIVIFARSGGCKRGMKIGEGHLGSQAGPDRDLNYVERS